MEHGAVTVTAHVINRSAKPLGIWSTEASVRDNDLITELFTMAHTAGVRTLQNFPCQPPLPWSMRY